MNEKQHSVLAAIDKAVSKPVIVRGAPVLLRLDLACGQSPAEGYEGVDQWSGAKHVVDLQSYPWPFETNSCDALRSSHYIEHIPMEVLRDGPHRGKDALFAFFDECYRILRPGGEMKVICPCARSNRAFQDPTHRRFIVQETFFYFNDEWRKANKLDHYNAVCNFGFSANPIIPIEMTVLHPDSQARKFNESWNAVLDWDVSMTSLKQA